VEKRECRLIFLLKRVGKPKARILREKAGTIPKMGNGNMSVARAPSPVKSRKHDQLVFPALQNIVTVDSFVIQSGVEEPCVFAHAKDWAAGWGFIAICGKHRSAVFSGTGRKLTRSVTATNVSSFTGLNGKDCAEAIPIQRVIEHIQALKESPGATKRSKTLPAPVHTYH